jgi:LacI family transcriptional regulator
MEPERKMRVPATRATPTRDSRGIPTISIFVETATSWGRRVVAGILSYAKEHGPWHIQIEPTGPDVEPKIPENWRGDGVIARVATRSFADRLESLGVPVVNVSSIKIPGVDHPRVTTSSDAVCRMAVDHFTVRGFRNFAYVGNLDQSYIKSQFEAFVAALGDRGLRCDACLDPGGSDAIAGWLQALQKPTGVLCWGPRIGRLVIDACLASGIAVPHDVAVLGADYDELQSEASHPPQSGIRMASEQIGLIAAGVLDSLMAGRTLDQNQWEITSGGVVAKASSDTLAVDDPKMAVVMRFIQSRFREPIDMPEILRAVPMARRSLERKFRQTFGMSVIDRIRQIRVNEARLLLAATDEPITLIAEKCGFASYNYMGRIFQADTGMTPREYRAQFRARKF